MRRQYLSSAPDLNDAGAATKESSGSTSNSPKKQARRVGPAHRGLAGRSVDWEKRGKPARQECTDASDTADDSGRQAPSSTGRNWFSQNEEGGAGRGSFAPGRELRRTGNRCGSGEASEGSSENEV
jgi:hypothetical protein